MIDGLIETICTIAQDAGVPAAVLFILLLAPLVFTLFNAINYTTHSLAYGGDEITEKIIRKFKS